MFSQLVAGSPSVQDYQSKLAAFHCNLGVLLTKTGQQAEAERAYRQAIALLEKLAAESPSIPHYRSNLASSCDNLGDLLRMMGRLEAAERAHRQAVALFEKLVAESPSVHEDQTGLAESNAHLAILLLTAGRAAGEGYDRAIALAKKLSDPEAQNELSWALATSPSRALRDFQIALRLAKNAVEQEPQAGDYWNTLGVAHYRVGDGKEAIQALKKSMELRKGGDPLRLVLPGHGLLAERRHGQGPFVVRQGRPVDGEEQLARRGAGPLCAEAAALLRVTDDPKSAGRKEETTSRASKP